MKKLIKKSIVAILIVPISHSCIAGVGSNLGNYFDGLGYNTHVNDPTAYKSQSAYYYSAGSMHLKNNVSNIQPVSVQLPSITAGCGGIDIMGGGLSFINSDKMKEFANDVAQNGAGLALDLGIQTLTPQLHAVITKMQDWAQKINGFNMNSCDTARAGIDAIKSLSESNDSNKSQCTENLVTEKGYSWADAKEKCNSDPKGVLSRAKKDGSGNSDTINLNLNIGFNELMKIDIFSSGDKTLAELVMSLSGTVIYDGNQKKHSYPSLATNNDTLLNALMYGGKYQYYKCDTTEKKADSSGCINPTLADGDIKTQDALVFKTERFIDDIVTSLQQDTAVTESEKSFLQHTKLPILRLMASILESHENVDDYKKDYAIIIASNLISQYLKTLAGQMDQVLSQSTSNPKDLVEIRHNIDLVVDRMSDFPMDAKKNLTMKYNIIQQRKKDEKYIQASMNNLLSAGE